MRRAIKRRVKHLLSQLPHIYRQTLLRINTPSGSFWHTRTVAPIEERFKTSVKQSRLPSGKVLLVSPRYVNLASLNDKFQTTDEIANSLSEYIPQAQLEVIFRDELLSTGVSQQELVRRILDAGASHVLYVLGPSPTFDLDPLQAKELFTQLSAVRILFCTDAFIPEHHALVCRLADAVDLVITFDSPLWLDHGFRKDNILHAIPAPIAEKTYKQLVVPHLQGPRPTDLIYVGSLYPDRQRMLDYLTAELPIRIQQTNNSSGNRLDWMSYWRQLTSSKLTLNMGSHPLIPDGKHLKGRTVEGPIAGSVLLSDETILTSRFLTPERDYIPFKTRKDLKHKIRKLLNDQDELALMAKRAHEKCVEFFVGARWWSRTDTRLADLGFPPLSSCGGTVFFLQAPR